MNKTKVTYLVIGLLIGIVGTLYVTNPFERIAVEQLGASAGERLSSGGTSGQFRRACKRAGGTTSIVTNSDGVRVYECREAGGVLLFSVSV